MQNRFRDGVNARVDMRGGEGKGWKVPERNYNILNLIKINGKQLKVIEFDRNNLRD
jgi:hypothetical protein